jgi:hypothetical protein
MAKKSKPKAKAKPTLAAAMYPHLRSALAMSAPIGLAMTKGLKK